MRLGEWASLPGSPTQYVFIRRAHAYPSLSLSLSLMFMLFSETCISAARWPQGTCFAPRNLVMRMGTSRAPDLPRAQAANGGPLSSRAIPMRRGLVRQACVWGSGPAYLAAHCHPLGGTTCLTLLVYTASFVLCAVYSVKDHHNLQMCSPLLKKTCVRQVVLDKWFPPNPGPLRAASGPLPQLQPGEGVRRRSRALRQARFAREARFVRGCEGSWQ